VEDIEKEILEVADIVIDYGLVQWWIHGRSSTALDFSGPNIQVARIGACYDVIKHILNRYWKLELPDDPGKEALPSGHLRTLPALKSWERFLQYCPDEEVSKDADCDVD
jgi:hypothetical protein